MAVREAFREWLGAQQDLQRRTRDAQWQNASRIMRAYGDLDEAYDQDEFATIRNELSYSRDDETQGRANPSRFEINGDLYANLASYRATLNYYTRFRQSEAGSSGSRPQTWSMSVAELERLKALFLARYPDFSRLTFAAGHGSYWDEERGYKEDILAGARAILDREDLSLEATGQAIIDLLRDLTNFINWRTFHQINDLSPGVQRAIAAALGEMMRADDGDAAMIAAKCAAAIHPLITGGGAPAYGDVRSLVTIALALARPKDAVGVKTRYVQRATRQLIGRGVFKNGVMTAPEYGELLAIVEAIHAVMKDEWRWSPRDLWDVQGFLWVTSGEADEAAAESAGEEQEEPVQVADEVYPSVPTNLILYGPPGTGKTYATASKAVELCDGGLPGGGRESVMGRYKELVERKRISFVTFHQSYAYEDFVEGLRPVAGSDDGDEGGAGFSLRPRPGVFRNIADLARDNHGRAIEPPKLEPRPAVWKMSLGRSNQEEGARFFRDALEGGYVLLGWGGEIDWSAPQYDDFGAVKRRWQEDHPEATGNDSNIQQLYALRGGMKVGDLIVVSDGNVKFKGIAQVTGPYQFVLGPLREYNHRRPVRWLWHTDESLPRDLIYRKDFMMKSCYGLYPDQILWPALEQIISGGGQGVRTTGRPEAFVLIIDEINRANISKVFGELITLIEPDKRLGADNELTVTLPYSGERFGVPANLHIVATMNTADRSIALLDTALRRRFEFEELLPDPTTLGKASLATDVDLEAVLTGLNARIEYLFDRDHQIGHAFFIGCRSYADLTRVMRTKVIPLLAEYFYENWEKVRQVLGERSDEGQFIRRVTRGAPAAAEVFASEEGRWRYEVLDAFPPAAYEQLKA
jgi:5-methylcytosine-specific restriction enzyme B